MHSPLLLSDFLTDAYKCGGDIAVLALSGLFVLITQYSLECSDYYSKLYQLITPRAFALSYVHGSWTVVSIYICVCVLDDDCVN